MKNVNGRLSTPVTTAKCGPSPEGMTSSSQCAIASTMPVPWNTPMSTAAANTIATTETMLDEVSGDRLPAVP